MNVMGVRETAHARAEVHRTHRGTGRRSRSTCTIGGGEVIRCIVDPKSCSMAELVGNDTLEVILPRWVVYLSQCTN